MTDPAAPGIRSGRRRWSSPRSSIRSDAGEGGGAGNLSADRQAAESKALPSCQYAKADQPGGTSAGSLSCPNNTDGNRTKETQVLEVPDTRRRSSGLPTASAPYTALGFVHLPARVTHLLWQKQGTVTAVLESLKIIEIYLPATALEGESVEDIDEEEDEDYDAEVAEATAALPQKQALELEGAVLR